MKEGLKALGVQPERPDWYRDPQTGAWRLTTSRQLLNASQGVPAQEDLARRVAGVLPKPIVGPRRKKAQIFDDDEGWRVQAGYEWQ